MSTTLNLDIAAELNITMRRGDTFSFEIDVKLEDGSLFDFSGYSAKFSVKKTKADETSLVTLTETDGISLQEGLIIFNALFSLAPGKYFHDFQVTSLSGKVETWFSGALQIRYDVGV